MYGIRRVETDGTFMIGDSPVTVDAGGDVTVAGVTYEGTEVFWEFPTKKEVACSLIMQADRNAYKRILESTNGHLCDNAPVNKFKTTRGAKYRETISKLFPHTATTAKQQRPQRWTT